MYVYDGEGASLLFEFIVGGEYVSPSSAIYTLRGHDGTAVLTDQSIVLAAGATDAVVAVGAANNALSGSQVVQNRYVDVQFVVNGQIYRLRQTYTIIEYPLYTASVADVRALIGLFDHELKDSEVDIHSAYLDVEKTVTSSILSAAFAAADRTNVQANKAIACQAALSILPSLRLRAIQKTGDDNIEVSRFSKVDFDQIEAAISLQYSRALFDLNPSATSTDPNLMTVTAPIDPITGT